MIVTIETKASPDDGRMRRRLETMRRVQDCALPMFLDRGFEAVTIEQIATESGVGPATIYRNFGTKERVVLWDEYDPMLFDAIRRRLPSLPIQKAVLDALVECLDDVYVRDRERILQRAGLIEKHPTLRTTAVADRAQMQQGLAELLITAGASEEPLEADVIAGVIVAVLSAAAQSWVRNRGKTSLARAIRRGFKMLDRLTASSVEKSSTGTNRKNHR